MLKRAITYTDYNGNTRTEDFYFNISKAELAEMELTTNGGFGEMVQKIIKANDQPAVIKLFKKIILKAYGEKTPDGKYFNKSEALSDAFSHTEAYSELFMELATDSEAASAFVNGIIPQDVKPAKIVDRRPSDE